MPSRIITLFLLLTVATPAIASLPNREKLTFVGVSQPNTEQHAWNYIDSKSIQKRGKLKFSTQWTFWRYKRGKIVASKSTIKAECDSWELTMLNFQGVDAGGNGGEVHKSNTKIDTSPDTVGDNILKFICK